MLHIVYRSYGGENKKGRPDFYSKRTALVSLIRAFDALAPGEAELIFLNDGPIPKELLGIMERCGEVIPAAFGGNAPSLRAAFSLPAERHWKSDDLVWFAEDDYLYLPHSLTGLVSAAERLPNAEYFALYAMFGNRLPNAERADPQVVPPKWMDSDPVLVDAHPWRLALSTTSTFGARVGAVVADRAVMDIAIMSGGNFDHRMCLMLQGHVPFRWADLTEPVKAATTVGKFAHTVSAATVRAGVNVYSSLRTAAGKPKRPWIAPDPALVTHLETGVLAVGTDWRALALETENWAAKDGRFLASAK